MGFPDWSRSNSASSRNPSGLQRCNIATASRGSGWHMTWLQHRDGYTSEVLTARPWEMMLERLPSFWSWVLVTFQGLCVKLQVGNDLQVGIISTVFHLHGQIYSTSMIFRFPETTRNFSSAKNWPKQPRKKKECSHPRPKVSKKFAIPSILCTQTTSLLGRLQRASQPEKNPGHWVPTKEVLPR